VDLRVLHPARLDHPALLHGAHHRDHLRGVHHHLRRARLRELRAGQTEQPARLAHWAQRVPRVLRLAQVARLAVVSVPLAYLPTFPKWLRA